MRRDHRHHGHATAILSRIPADRIVTTVEVGVWKGVLSRILLRERPLLRLTMVDLWGPNPSSAYAATGDIMAKDRTERQWNAIANIAAKEVAFARSRATILRMDSLTAAAAHKDGTFDLVFIDDDHSYEGCVRSIEAWANKVAPGGWLGGHDYGPNKRNPQAVNYGVTDAVHSFCRQTGMAFQTDHATTWWMRIPARIQETA